MTEASSMTETGTYILEGDPSDALVVMGGLDLGSKASVESFAKKNFEAFSFVSSTSSLVACTSWNGNGSFPSMFAPSYLHASNIIGHVAPF